MVKLLYEVIYMANVPNTKLRLLHVLDILNKKTDEGNILTSNDIVRELEDRGLTGERRSVIRDINTLIEYGYDICPFEENNIGYYMRSRLFEEEEIKILIDSVIAFKALSPRKTRQLIKKLLSLSSNRFAKKTMGNLYIDSKGKSENECVYYNINMIEEATSKDKKISFKYLTYDINKEQKFRKEGEDYIVSPYALVWRDDNYYLIGVHDKYSNISHYRVDRINQVKILDENRKLAQHMESIEDFNVTKYMDSTFNVFTGEEERVMIRFTNDLLNAIIDKFGVDVTMFPKDDGHSIIIADVLVSEGFISWILQFGGKVQLLEPAELRDEVKERILELNKAYGM